MTTELPELRQTVSLDDKWTAEQGRILISGTQAIARLLLAQRAIDLRAGLDTAGYVSGYRGSPLGGVDTLLWSIADRLEAARIRFAPGVNEDLAATALRGTQQLDSVPGALCDGVFAAWYGKGPGVDRSGDALKHGNLLGAHRNGGVVLFYGDDHAAKSSTVAHHSEQAMAAAYIPSFYPADVSEILHYGLMAYAASRYSGAWIGMKLVGEVAEQTRSVLLDLAGFAPILPDGPLPPEGVNVRPGPFNPMRDEQIAIEHRLPRLQAFVAANRIDRTAFKSHRPRLGLVTTGKSHGDTLQALELLGLDPGHAASLGLSLYKIGCIWPVEPEGLCAFAAGHKSLFFIEEKVSFVEAQAAAILINRSGRPLLIGKQDEEGRPLLSASAPLEPARLAIAIADRLQWLGVDDPAIAAARVRLGAGLPTQSGNGAALPRRTPYFCSGCPHSRSTKIPEGSLSMTGIGCHTMVAFARPEEALLPTQMGGEGANWIGLAPFTRTRHIFQNMGDGTYYHSGLLAIRAAVASGVNITYKILYNDAVAMTGGQPVDGPISVAEIAHQVRHEGVGTIVLVSDDPERHIGNAALPAGLEIHHRDRLDSVQRRLRDEPGCTILIYEQTCAAEKRRRRKRGLYPDPPKRLFIATDVCEGCGDCSVQATCVSLTPVETDFGTKRRIDQSSCNKDYSCLNGFCPSFVSVEGVGLRKPVRAAPDVDPAAGLDTPLTAALGDRSFNLMVAGIGGTGVVTVAAIIGMATHIEGHIVSLYDMTGLAQKNGAVFSHVRIAASSDQLHAQRLGRGEADLLIAFDLVAGLAEESAQSLAGGRTRAIVNDDVAATIAFQFDRDAAIDRDGLEGRLRAALGEDAVESVAAVNLARALLGDTIGANLFLVGLAAQRGLLPIGVEAIEQAIALNGTAVALNLAAFRYGRLYAAHPQKLAKRLPAPQAPADQGLEAVIQRHADRLKAYQDERYAGRFQSLIRRVAEAEAAVAPGSEALSRAAAATYGRLLAYKDEYEVARLLTSATLQAELAATFAEGGRLHFHLAPPFLPGKDPSGRPRKRRFDARYMRPLLRLVASLRRLRGSPLDPFGWTEERRAERALISDYEALVERVLADLRPEALDRAERLLGLASEVRGFGPVKQAAIETYRVRLAEAEAAAA